MDFNDEFDAKPKVRKSCGNRPSEEQVIDALKVNRGNIAAAAEYLGITRQTVYNRMQKNNLIDFIPDARGEVNIPTFLGREVIVDDGVPRTSNVYDTWLFGAGSTQMGMGSAKVPTEVDRKAGAGNGGGQDVLYNRVEWCLHPVGHAWSGTAPNGGPANTGTAGDDLDEAGSWNRVYPERKQIKFARLVTREA